MLVAADEPDSGIDDRPGRRQRPDDAAGRRGHHRQHDRLDDLSAVAPGRVLPRARRRGRRVVSAMRGVDDGTDRRSSMRRGLRARNDAPEAGGAVSCCRRCAKRWSVKHLVPKDTAMLGMLRRDSVDERHFRARRRVRARALAGRSSEMFGVSVLRSVCSSASQRAGSNAAARGKWRSSTLSRRSMPEHRRVLGTSTSPIDRVAQRLQRPAAAPPASGAWSRARRLRRTSSCAICSSVSSRASPQTRRTSSVARAAPPDGATADRSSRRSCWRWCPRRPAASSARCRPPALSSMPLPGSSAADQHRLEQIRAAARDASGLLATARAPAQ